MATQRRQMYKCDICGAVVEILDSGCGSLVCCSNRMTLVNEASASADAAHRPLVTCDDGMLSVSVGQSPHPMENEHFIEWIEVVADGAICRHFLQPGQPAQTTFDMPAAEVTVRGYCSLHGLWKG
ncbi:MAG: desulfoferrodoxin FeS4 iron-binding domain-containing protein [Planctomycetaceae bacterium]|nr:MAG: desulfoferrodoxin FeS4 iron-binding domain-containing protein [Planctomycetaceae bacterium]